ncbi:hypothetical protein NPIL_432881 [Nephila pilipes]|uniref:Uncharacterized protein n=1 Tax=Nephila pilipes TaxID=299642 RepID=A0A8X6QES5_NEPPI|nr:hypothetical protein NPIL_432881 [Nephila pilipes]
MFLHWTCYSLFLFRERTAIRTIQVKEAADWKPHPDRMALKTEGMLSVLWWIALPNVAYRCCSVLLCPALVTFIWKRARSPCPHGDVANHRDNLGDSEGLLVEVMLCSMVEQMAKEAADALMNQHGSRNARREATSLESTLIVTARSAFAFCSVH